MMFSIVALTVLCGQFSQAARLTKKRKGLEASNASEAPPYSNVYTTYDGCECQDNSRCAADIGTGFKCDTCKTKGRCGKSALFYTWDYCDYRPSTMRDFIDRSWENKVDYFWEKITADTSSNQDYPLLSAISISVRTSFDNYRPEVPTGRPKVIHSMGSICQFKLDVTSASPYTGIFSPGRRTGFIRMGSAVSPGGDGVTPGLGIKIPRSGVHDADVVLLYSLGFGYGWNFFAKNQSNHLEPADGVIAVAAEKFKDASQCPYQVGLSDMARYSQEGVESNPPKFPFKIMAIVNPELKTVTEESLDAMHSEIDAIPVGTTLYQIWACAEPRGDEMKPTENLEDNCGGALHLGNLVTSSQCTTSLYGDEQFYIRHQRIEDDWLLEPSFMQMGSYSATKACEVRSLTADGAPPICGQDGMLASDV